MNGRDVITIRTRHLKLDETRHLVSIRVDKVDHLAR